jgi:putative acetyltransferase
MKIRKLTQDNYPKAAALLRKSFPGSSYEEKLVDNLHENGRDLLDWVCIHRNKFIAYIAFSNAYADAQVCGLHLGPLAVHPQHQKQGIGSELLQFALRQNAVREKTIFVLGNPKFYKKFGFEPCKMPICPFDQDNDNFLSIRNNTSKQYEIDYEPEFDIGI